MRIIDVLNKKMSFSFEVFPPKEEQPLEPLLDTLDNLYKYVPDFVSVTYGAGGTNRGRSEEVCKAIMEKDCNVMTHFTCIGSGKKDVEEQIRRYVSIGIENILALRGDFPKGWKETHGYFQNGDRLINFIKSRFPKLCIGAACYPEGHVSAASMEADISRIRSKQDNGADFLMTQLCYDVDAYERFVERLTKAGVTLPIIVGVMPVLFKDGLIRMTTSNGCSIPPEVSKLIGRYGDSPEDFKEAGKEYTIELLYKYINRGIAGLHVYSLNKYKDLAEIINESGLRGRF